MVFFVFILFVAHGTSSVYNFMSLIRIRKLSVLISSNISPAPFSLSFPSGTPITYTLSPVILSHRLQKLYSFCFSLFFFFVLRTCNLCSSVFKLAGSPVVSKLLKEHLLNFLFQRLYFSFLEFPVFKASISLLRFSNCSFI